MVWVSLAFGVPTLTAIIVEGLLEHRVGWQLLVFAVGGALVVWWVASHRILISDRELAYGAGFGRSRRIRLDGIRSVRLEAGERTYRDRFRPLYRLVVQPYGGRPFDIDLRMFEASDCLLLVDALQSANVVVAQADAALE